MDTPEHIQTYRQCLIKLGYGCPLYEPDPSRYEHVQIGDVGYVDSVIGHFHRVFNVFFHANHHINRRYGIPDNFEPLELNLRAHVRAADHAVGVHAVSLSLDRSAGIDVEGYQS